MPNDLVTAARQGAVGFLGLERTEAIVLRGVDFSETSRIVTFLTPERGRMACMAKGIRRPKSELSALLNTFNKVELVYFWKDSRSVQDVREASLLDGYPAIRRDLARATCAAVPLETVYRAVHENEPSEALFAWVCRGLETLSEPGSEPAAVTVWWLFRLLAELGYEPQVEGGEGAAGFSFESGMMSERSDVRLSAAAANDFRRLAVSEAMPQQLDAAAEVLRVLGTYAEHHVATRLKSIHVMNQILG